VWLRQKEEGKRQKAESKKQKAHRKGRVFAKD
jgi:hypothetical protein